VFKARRGTKGLLDLRAIKGTKVIPVQQAYRDHKVTKGLLDRQVFKGTKETLEYRVGKETKGIRGTKV
jgi:hypothetical protein